MDVGRGESLKSQERCRDSGLVGNGRVAGVAGCVRRRLLKCAMRIEVR